MIGYNVQCKRVYSPENNGSPILLPSTLSKLLTYKL